jgi:transposase-like protein
MALDPKQYADTLGVHCPECESTDVKPGAVEFFSGGASQDCLCISCGATWADDYQLVGYFRLMKEA